MVRIVNGEVCAAGTVQKRSSSPLDKIAELFWGLVSFITLFFNSMFAPKGGTFKPAVPAGRRNVGRINHGGSSNTKTNGSPLMGGGGC
mmetsp:Transcript_129833/g.416621  ORF Transcript_129833/g.416621 Transcript_129833/m.416621 type:complete len:88 (-) Transcript_129833:7-270(-)